MPTYGGTPLRVGRVSTRRRRRRHECRPTAGRHFAWLGFQPDDVAVGMHAGLRAGRHSTWVGFQPDDVAVGMHADLRAERHSTWLGLQPDGVAVGMNADLRRDATPRGSGFSPTTSPSACMPTYGGTPLRVARVSTRRRRRRHACRPTGGTPLRVARVSTRRRRRRHECRPTAGRHSAWLGFQPDDLAVGMNADLRTGHRTGRYTIAVDQGSPARWRSSAKASSASAS